MRRLEIGGWPFPCPERRTLLGHYLVQYGWTGLEFCDAFAKAALDLGANTHGSTGRKAKRWLSGAVATRPRPPARRVLERMFDATVDALLCV